MAEIAARPTVEARARRQAEVERRRQVRADKRAMWTPASESGTDGLAGVR